MGGTTTEAITPPFFVQNFLTNLHFSEESCIFTAIDEEWEYIFAL